MPLRDYTSVYIGTGFGRILEPGSCHLVDIWGRLPLLHGWIIRAHNMGHGVKEVSVLGHLECVGGEGRTSGNGRGNPVGVAVTNQHFRTCKGNQNPHLVHM